MSRALREPEAARASLEPKRRVQSGARDVDPLCGNRRDHLAVVHLRRPPAADRHATARAQLVEIGPELTDLCERQPDEIEHRIVQLVGVAHVGRIARINARFCMALLLGPWRWSALGPFPPEE